MSRLRLNQELRNKISSRWRIHAEQEETDEKEKYFRARESIKPKQDSAWDLTHTVVEDTTPMMMSKKQDTYKTSLIM